MFLTEEIRDCPACRERTPHSERGLALPKLVATVFAVFALPFVIFEAFLVSGALLVAAGGLWIFDRDQCWSVDCERCRAKARVELRRKRPTLDGKTEIQIL